MASSNGIHPPGGTATAVEAVDDIARAQERLREHARGIVSGAAAADGAAARLNRGTVLALGALLAADELQNAAVLAFGPEISRALGISRGAVASLLVVKTLALVAAAVPAAGLVQRRLSARRPWVAQLAGAVAGAALVCAAFAVAPGALLLAFLASGVAAGAAQTVHTPIVYEAHAPGARLRALAGHRAGAPLGVVAALLLVAATGAAGFTWRAGFVVAGGLCLAAVAAALRLRDPGYGRHDVDPIRAAVRAGAGAGSDASPAPDGEEGLDLGLLEVVRRIMLVTTVRRVLVATALLGMLAAPLQSYLSFFLDERFDLAPGPRAAALAVTLLATVPALVWFGRRGERVLRDEPGGLVPLTSKLLLLVVPALVVAVAAPVWPLALVAFAAVFVVVVVVQPALVAATFPLVAPRMRPHLAALHAVFLAGVGGVGGVLLLNGIDRRFGIGGAILALAGPAVVAALLLRDAGRTADADLSSSVDDVVEREEIRLLLQEGRHLPMLSCRHVDFSYGQLQVLFDVSFTVDDGEMVALLGTNGAGKSTLLRVISGLGLPSRGSVTYRGADITFLDAERRLGLGITQIPGGKATFGPLSVVENLRVYGYSLGRSARAVDAGIDATFAAFPRLAERRNQAATTLSGGEQQMLALGKAFILRPRLLLIDELSLGLAPKVVGELLETVRQINAGGTAVVLVEQSVNIALSLVDHAYFMEKGEMRFDGRAADLLDRRDLLRSVFLEGASQGLG